MSLTVGSVFSGIGGTDRAFELAGARVLWNCEIDAACRRVLRRHWPGIPRFKDVKTVTGSGLGAAGLRPDVLIGGFPCQDLSVAGARAGLNGERSGLFFEFARLLEEIRPRWFLIENVPGLLSSDRGGDMGVLLSALVNLGYGVAWRVLDAQYFGVAQRRRRVFVVGCAGDRARAAEVLLVGEGGGGDPPARGAAGADVARRPAGSPATGGGPGGDRGVGVQATAEEFPATLNEAHRNANGWGYTVDASSCLDAEGRMAVFVPETVQGLTGSFGNGEADDNKAQAGWLVPAVSNALVAPSTGGHHFDPNGEALVPVAYGKATTSHGPDNDWERWEEAAHSNTLDAGSNVTRNAHAVVQQPGSGADVASGGQDGGRTSMPSAPSGRSGPGGAGVSGLLAVRRLTPLECLRLQGFPDDWLDGLGLADSIKYRQVGNAVAVPVVTWIAKRMLEVHRGC